MTGSIGKVLAAAVGMGAIAAAVALFTLPEKKPETVSAPPPVVSRKAEEAKKEPEEKREVMEEREEVALPPPSVDIPADSGVDAYGRPKLDLSKIAGTLKLTVPSLSEIDRRLPLDYTCYRKNVSPALTWSGAPSGTKSYVLFLERRKLKEAPFLVWALYDIPASGKGLPANMPKSKAYTNGMRHALSDHDTAEYVGPCEPRGKIPYAFRLFALDTVLGVPAGLPNRDLMKAMNGHILDAVDVEALHYLRF